MSVSPVPSTSSAAHHTTIEAFVAGCSGVALVEVGATWCPPCRVMEPIVEAVAQSFAPPLRVLPVDADADPTVSAAYGIRGLPTLLVFRDGALVDRIVGATGTATLRERLARHVATGAPRS